MANTCMLDVMDPQLAKPGAWSGVRAYSQSKLCQVCQGMHVPSPPWGELVQASLAAHEGTLARASLSCKGRAAATLSLLGTCDLMLTTTVFAVATWHAVLI